MGIGCGLVGRVVASDTSGQSHKASTIVNYISRDISDYKFAYIITPDSNYERKLLIRLAPEVDRFRVF